MPSSSNYPSAHLFLPTSNSSKQKPPKLSNRIKIGGKHPAIEKKKSKSNDVYITPSLKYFFSLANLQQRS